MPETYFSVRWPDGNEESCYSPSSIVREYFEKDKSYPLEEFVRLSEQSLTLASERVRAKFGYACSSASDQLYQIKAKAERYKKLEEPTVTILRVGS